MDEVAIAVFEREKYIQYKNCDGQCEVPLKKKHLKMYWGRLTRKQCYKKHIQIMESILMAATGNSMLRDKLHL